MVETIGYEGITNETVDTESQYEKEIKELISKSQEDLGELENDSIKNLTDKQLAAYMTNQFLEGGVQRYSHYVNSNNLNTLEFCLRAALQLLGKGSDEKYDAKGSKAPDDPSAKTIDERLMASNGITVDGKVDDTIVRILQSVVGAEVDGKPGPQTIVKTVLKLGGNVSQYYGEVNNIYKGNSKYEIHDVETFTNDLLDRSYSYDLSKLTMMTMNGEVYLKPAGVSEPIKVTIDPNTKVPSLDGYVFKNGWVSKNGEVPDVVVEAEDATGFRITTGSGNYSSRYNLEAGNNNTAIESALYKTQFDNLASSFLENEYYWFNRNPYTGYNYSNNPFAYVNCGRHTSSSMGSGYYDPDFTVKINFHDFMEADGSLNTTKIINELNKIKAQVDNTSNIEASKSNLLSSIKEFTLGDLLLDEKKDLPGYIAFMSYFDNGKIKIDKKHTLPKWDDSGNLTFDLDPKGSGNCPEYFTGIKIDKNELVDNNGLYDLGQFKIAFAKKIDEIINTNILSTT